MIDHNIRIYISVLHVNAYEMCRDLFEQILSYTFHNTTENSHCVVQHVSSNWSHWKRSSHIFHICIFYQQVLAAPALYRNHSAKVMPVFFFYYYKTSNTKSRKLVSTLIH